MQAAYKRDISLLKVAVVVLLVLLVLLQLLYFCAYISGIGLLKPAPNVCVSACHATQVCFLKSAIFSFEWHLCQGLAAFLDSKTCLASVDFHLPAYNILGQTFPGWQVRPRKLSCVLTSFARANLFLQLLQLKCTIVHRTSPGWCTCSHFVSSRHCGLKVLTDGRDALQVWHTLTVRLAHFASGVRLPLPHCLLELPPPSLALWIIFSVWLLLQLQNQG